MRRRRALILAIELQPIGQVSEVSGVVLDDQDHLLHGWDAFVGLAGPVQVVDGATEILEQKCPISSLKYVKKNVFTFKLI